MKKAYADIINLESLAEIYFDEGKFDEHLSLWVKDEVVFESPFGSFDDGGAYIEWLKGFYNMTQGMGGTRHFVMNPVVTFDGDTAQFTGYLYIINKKNGAFMGTSVMKDKFKKTEDGWRFTYRSVAPDQDMSALMS